MSNQISEKMARKLARQVADYTCYEQADQSESESRCMRAWRAAGLIKSSKLDEARDMHKHFSEKINDGPEFRANGRWVSIQAYNRLAHRYEQAITEILEERE